jgi:hypothetical protein
MMREKKIRNIIPFFILILFSAWMSALKDVYWAALDYELLFNIHNAISILCYGLLHFLGLVLAVLVLFFPTCVEKITIVLKQHTTLSILLSIMCVTVPMYIFAFSDWGSIFSSPVLRIIFLIVDVFLFSFSLGAISDKKKILMLVLISSLLIGSSLSLGIRFRRVVDYPFSLNWSEGNRFWDYSTLFSKDRYYYSGEINALIDFGRLSLWGIVYLIPGLSLKMMRLWNDLLYILPSLILGIALFKNRSTPFRYVLLSSLWVYLFLNQGPIYAPLIIALILVILAIKFPLIPGLLLTMAVGYYAQLTRYTWSVAPAIWAGLLILLNQNDFATPAKRYQKSALYVISGTVGGIILPVFFPIQQGVYKAVEGTTTTIIDRASSTLSSQDLIWSRLLPNSTNSLGIILAILIATLPTLLIVFLASRKIFRGLGKWEKAYTLISLLATFLVGIIVSVKIGGGSNLHNFDMFLLTVTLLVGIFKEPLFQFLSKAEAGLKRGVPFLLILSIFLLFRNDLLNIVPLSLPSKSIQENALNSMQEEIDRRVENGEILFIDQRQLLTFDSLNTPLVADYEKKVLMNEAISQDVEYFSTFYDDLQTHRFSLIINEPLNIIYQEDEASYSEENNAYVKWVSEPLLCYYEPLKTFSEVGVELLIPRTSPIPDGLTCP